MTFYSYKGGTGRTMALANVAWILASSGKRVLVIDWDLEAPGLHRYFAPFLEDPELTSTAGLIDFFTAFVEGARLQLTQADGDAPWHLKYSDLTRFAVPIDYEFPADGTIDLVPAGRQGPAYGILINSVHWDEFYGRLGGGIFLETVKDRLKEQYDFILVDSRTGLSDTAGICTVQMPDQLVVCFTLNRQSVEGAFAVAHSATQMRTRPDGSPGLRVWPIAMRVELAEHDRLAAARKLARERFVHQLWHLTRTERESYWNQTEVLYFPYYAYTELLATIADHPNQTNSLQSAMSAITQQITGVEPPARMIDEQQRQLLLGRY